MPGSSSLGFMTTQRPPTPAVVAVEVEKEECEAPCIEVPRGALLAWNAAMSLFHATLCAVTLVAGNRELSVPLYKTVIDFVVRDPALGNDAGWDLVPAYRESGALALTWLVAAFFFISSLFHFLNATLLRAYYLRELAQCRTPTRWIEYFFSAALMMALIAYTLGVRERGVLLSATVLVATTMPFGYWTEAIARPASPDEWTEPFAYRIVPWVIGHVPQVTAWFLVVLQFYDGVADTNDVVPWFVHLILWGELLLFFSFGFVQLYAQAMPPKFYYRGELAFQTLSLVSKGLLGLLLLTNVLMLSRFEEIYEAQA
jgi:hypothetical protein